MPESLWPTEEAPQRILGLEGEDEHANDKLDISDMYTFVDNVEECSSSPFPTSVHIRPDRTGGAAA